MDSWVETLPISGKMSVFMARAAERFNIQGPANAGLFSSPHAPNRLTRPQANKVMFIFYVSKSKNEVRPPGTAPA